MSVNIEQVRKALKSAEDKFLDVGIHGTLYYGYEAEKHIDIDEILELLIDCEKMADEIEQLSEFKDYVGEYHGIHVFKEFEGWRKH
jgi:hypothetical protein